MKTAILMLLAVLTFTSCKPKAQILWTVQTDAPIYGSPSISGGNLIIGSSDHNLYALDLTTGKVAWKTNLGERILSKPLVEKDAVYAGAASGNFFSLNPADGQIRWRFKAGYMINYDACADETGLYFGSDDYKFYKINRQGQEFWHFQTGHQVWGNCVFYKNLVITSSWDSHFYGLDRATGSVVWKVSSGLINYGGPFLYGDSVFFGTHDKMYRLNAGTGKVLTLAKVNYLDHPVIFQDYLFTNENGLIKRTLEGKVLGSIPFVSNHMMTPVAGDGYLIVGAVRELIAVSPELKIVWKFSKAEDEFWAAGVIHNGVYYTGNRDGHVYALRLPK